jgi:predicted metalloprotease
MKWEDERESENVEDSAGVSDRRPGGALSVAGPHPSHRVLAHGSQPPRSSWTSQSTGSDTPSASTAPGPQGRRTPGLRPADKLGKFAAVVLAFNRRRLEGRLRPERQAYQEPKLVLFRSRAFRVRMASLATGPF